MSVGGVGIEGVGGGMAGGVLRCLPVAALVDNVGGTVYAIPNTLRLPRRVHDARGDYVSAPRRLQKTR